MQTCEQAKKANKGAEDVKSKLLTTKEAAALLGLAPHSLEQYRWRGTGPKFIKEPGKPGINRGRLSGLVYYREQDLWDWLGKPRSSTRDSATA